jgi:hypothetical protein
MPIRTTIVRPHGGVAVNGEGVRRRWPARVIEASGCLHVRALSSFRI